MHDLIMVIQLRQERPLIVIAWVGQKLSQAMHPVHSETKTGVIIQSVALVVKLRRFRGWVKKTPDWHCSRHFRHSSGVVHFLRSITILSILP